MMSLGLRQVIDSCKHQITKNIPSFLLVFFIITFCVASRYTISSTWSTVVLIIAYQGISHWVYGFIDESPPKYCDRKMIIRYILRSMIDLCVMLLVWILFVSLMHVAFKITDWSMAIAMGKWFKPYQGPGGPMTLIITMVMYFLFYLRSFAFGPLLQMSSGSCFSIYRASISWTKGRLKIPWMFFCCVMLITILFAVVLQLGFISWIHMMHEVFHIDLIKLIDLNYDILVVTVISMLLTLIIYSRKAMASNIKDIQT